MHNFKSTKIYTDLILNYNLYISIFSKIQRDFKFSLGNSILLKFDKIFELLCYSEHATKIKRIEYFLKIIILIEIMSIKLRVLNNNRAISQNVYITLSQKNIEILKQIEGLRKFLLKSL
jgi:hypothetical protein